MQDWAVTEFGVSAYPERADARAHKVDRLLAGGAGRLALWSSAVQRARLKRFAAATLSIGAGLEDLDDATLLARAATLRAALPQEGLSHALAIEGFALVREVSRRRLGMAHYPVQLMGGYALLRGMVAEMATGEGKTLTGLLPTILVALAGMPVHVVTVNEYLARRDAAELGPVFEFFGLTVGWTEPDQDPDTRRRMYASDVTFCVNKDLAFDYLKDGLAGSRHEAARRRALQRFLLGADAGRLDRRLLRGLCFALVDEADSIFIDEARTPLIISAEQREPGDDERFAKALELASQLPADAYRVHPAERAARLTPAGRDRVADATANYGGLWRFRRAREQLAEQALAALHLYLRDKHYIVVDGKVQIVDESTGRTMPDRSWEHGLHQMIELKEGLEMTARRATIARITFQRYFGRYLCLAGMTGTAAEVAPEVRAVYGLHTVRIPTHRPVMRRNLGEQVFLRAEDRWAAVAARIVAMVGDGRAVLAGTRSVEASEHLAALLAAAGVEYTLLNARHDEEEAEIIAAAGQPGRVTVATNMAGRGTDIKLDPRVRAAGGLHVILTEYHESRRIDRQLYGRAGRQGDPGSCESLVSVEDELFRTHAPRLAAAVEGLWSGRCTLPAWAGATLRRAAQGAAERRNGLVRKRTLESERNKDRRLAFAGAGE